MAKPKKPAWFSILPGALDPSEFSFDELRNAKAVHAFLSESVDGPAGIAEYIRAFRFLLFFGIACIAEDKYPPLTRCWKELERHFMTDPAFDDGVFVQSWILMDFPFGPKGETALDHFDDFLKGTDVGPHFQRFIAAARKSRLGLHQDIMRSKKVAKFRELLSGKVTEAFPSIEEYGKGEILLARMMAYDNQVFVFGNPCRASRATTPSQSSLPTTTSPTSGSAVERAPRVKHRFELHIEIPMGRPTTRRTGPFRRSLRRPTWP